MENIIQNNAKMLQQSALFLIVSGILIGLTGILGENYASVFLGFSFAVLCVICYILIEFDKALIAKILWGFITPLLIFISPCLFTLKNPVTVISYSFAYAAGLLYTTYTFRGKNERKYLWSTVALFFLCFMFYDRFMIEKSFQNSPYVKIFIDHFWYFKMYQAVHFISLVYLVYRIEVNKLQIEASLQKRITKLHSFVTNLINTSKNSLVYSGDLLNALKEILLHTAQVLDVSRISIWELNNDRESIDLIVGYDLQSETFFQHQTLKHSEHPIYFQHLLDEKIIMAKDALNDPRTAEFKTSYLEPLNIKSLMDSPFFIDGKFKGVLCCEEQRAYKTWDQMDQLFALSVSKLISISYYCTIRKEQYDQLIATSKRLKFKNTTILQVNEKFKEMRNTLTENISDHKIEDLVLQKRMEEMAFKNAHHVRGPLSRILGLIALYKTDPIIENKLLYISYIEKSAEDLDLVISEINQLLNQEG